MGLDEFPSLCFRVRSTILARYGPVASRELLLILDLVEMLWRDKVERSKDAQRV